METLRTRDPPALLFIFNISVTDILYSWILLLFRNFLEIIILSDQGMIDENDLDQVISGTTILCAMMVWSIINIYKTIIN